MTTTPHSARTLPPLHEIAGPAGTLPNPYDDTELLARHAAHGHDPADVLYLSLGETWSSVAPGLRAALATVPLHAHGYMLSPYGLPALRRALRSHIPTSHRLTEIADLGADYEVAATHGSTRSAMFHFGRLLLEDTDAGQPVAVCATPGWDYAGVFTALGFEMRHFPLVPEREYQPDAAEVANVLLRARRDTRGPLLLILNAQHNPTGANWAPATVREMVQAALAAGAAVLVDDAYYAVHDPGITPTSALAILLDTLRGLPQPKRPRWLAVRSLGKQAHCNGWGIGSAAAAPDTMEALYARLLPQHTYVSATPLQAAMAAWLQDPDSEHFLARQREEYAARRRLVADRLRTRLGYPEAAFFPGDCTSYMLIRIPPWYQTEEARTGEDWRRYCLRRAGVLLGEAHMTTPGYTPNALSGYVRLYLGHQAPILATALDRMAQADLTWTPDHPTAAGTPRALPHRERTR